MSNHFIRTLKWIEELLGKGGRLTMLSSVGLVAITLPGLGKPSFWTDEVASVFIAQLPSGEFLALVTGREINMALYYAILRLWLLLGESEFTVRLLSVLIAVGALWALFFLARRIGGEKVATVAVLMLVTNALFVTYAQEARAYSLLVLLTSISTLTFLRLVENPTGLRSLVYVLSGVAIVYTHFFGLLVLGAHALSVALSRWRLTLTLPFLFAWSLIAFSAVPLFLAMTRFSGALSWMDNPNLRSIYYMAHALTGSGGELLLLLYVATCGFATVAIAYGEAWPDKMNRRFLILFLLCGIISPVIIAFVASQLSPMFAERYLIIVLPPLAILAALGLVELKYPVLKWAMLTIWLGLSVHAVSVIHSQLTTEDLRGATRYLLESAQAGDAVVYYTPSWMRNGVNFYSRRLGLVSPPFEVKYPTISSFALASRGETEAIPRDLATRIRRSHARVWLVLGHDWSKSSAPISMALQNDLERAFGTGDVQHFEGRIRVIRYGPAP